MDTHTPLSSSLSWLLFCHSLPAKPASGRAKIWRKLNKIGAIKLKGAVYLLPFSEEHRERLQWLLAEVTALGGEGAFAESDYIEPLSNEEIIALFHNQSEAKYRQLNELFDEIAQEIARITAEKAVKPKQIYNRIGKLERKLFKIKKTDFFAAPYGLELQRRLQILKQEVDRLSLKKNNGNSNGHRPELVRNIEEFRGKTWVTRSNPFVDRMASAWLIKNYIDPQARFAFISNEQEAAEEEGCITYDISGGDFTHISDLCTFEVLIQAFNLSAPGLARVAELVHALDLHDQKGRHPEIEGVEAVLRGIRQTASNSHEALEKGMEIFAALHATLRP
jgi:uncharacterized protein with PIN domain